MENEIGVSNRVSRNHARFEEFHRGSRDSFYTYAAIVVHSLGVDGRKRHGGGSSTRGKVMRSVVSCLFRISARSVVEFRHERPYFTEKG